MGKFTDIKKAIADKGAQANGTTWYDRTNYYEILSASDENLKWALDMEACRMVNSKILATELSKEFSVVRNDFKIGETYPGNLLSERIISSMYLWHNYGMSTIGSKEEKDKSVTSWLEQNKNSLGSNEYVAQLLRTYVEAERALNDFVQLENKVKSLSLDAVNQALRKYFDTNKLILIYSGDFEKKVF